MRKPTFWFPTWSDTNQAVQLHIMARGLKLRIQEVEGLYHPCCENKGADQLRVNAKLIYVFVFADAKCLFSHDTAHVINPNKPNGQYLFIFFFFSFLGVSGVIFIFHFIFR